MVWDELISGHVAVLFQILEHQNFKFQQVKIKKMGGYTRPQGDYFVLNFSKFF
jgi:hypothetical protein